MKLTEAIAPWEPEWDQLDHSEDDDMLDDEDWPGGTCGRWSNGRLTGSCRLAGTEECDFECPHRDSLYGTPLGLSTLESRRAK